MKKIVIVTGGFDPLHSGHVNYLECAKNLGDILVVGINSDSWLTRKKGRAFLSLDERATIIRSMKCVDHVISFNDDDGTAIDAINVVVQMYPDDHIIFANGGDRTKDNIPEMVFDDVEFIFGVGGDNKMNSSSWILNKWKDNATERNWGKYKVLSEIGNNVKVKELVVDPNKRLSLQKHKRRNELWFVSEGKALVAHNGVLKQLGKYDTINIMVDDWHQLINDTLDPLHIVEIQYGEQCVEDDIERKNG